ncbi:hypothetical protein C8R44DRAFT_893134 [Mycena epipterygia]|nr:hypothetical protein C8R44DRAFT_893134 [Mycena epipterygia]
MSPFIFCPFRSLRERVRRLTDLSIGSRDFFTFSLFPPQQTVTMDESAPQCLAEIVNTRTFSSSTPIPSLPAYIFRAADLIAPKDVPDYPLLPEEDNSYMLDDAEKESLLFLDTPFVALLLPFAIVPARIARINPDYIIGLLRKSLFAFVSSK